MPSKVRTSSGTKRSSDYLTFFTLGRAALEAGQISQAVELFETQRDIYSAVRLNSCIQSVKLHYYLGIAYEESRWNDKAKESFSTFLNIWKNADPSLEAVKDAKERLARIKSSS